jgi:hypothetical protein
MSENVTMFAASSLGCCGGVRRIGAWRSAKSARRAWSSWLSRRSSCSVLAWRMRRRDSGRPLTCSGGGVLLGPRTQSTSASGSMTRGRWQQSCSPTGVARGAAIRSSLPVSRPFRSPPSRPGAPARPFGGEEDDRLDDVVGVAVPAERVEVVDRVEHLARLFGRHEALVGGGLDEGQGDVFTPIPCGASSIARFFVNACRPACAAE